MRIQGNNEGMGGARQNETLRRFATYGLLPDDQRKRETSRGIERHKVPGKHYKNAMRIQRNNKGMGGMGQNKTLRRLATYGLVHDGQRQKETTRAVEQHQVPGKNYRNAMRIQRNNERMGGARRNKSLRRLATYDLVPDC